MTDANNRQSATGAATDELRDDQLDQVTGGLVVPSIIGILVGPLHVTIQSVKDAVSPSK